MIRTSDSQQQKKKTWQFVDFAFPTDHKVKLKENKKRNKYLDFVRELKKLRNMKVMVIPIVIDVLGTVTKGLVQWLEDWEIRGRERPSKLLRHEDRLEYWEESWRLEGVFYRSNSSEIPSANAGVKNWNG